MSAQENFEKTQEDRRRTETEVFEEIKDIYKRLLERYGEGVKILIETKDGQIVEEYSPETGEWIEKSTTKN